MRNFLFTLLIALGAFSGSFAKAEDLAISRALLEDVSGTLSIAEAVTHEFQPAGPSFVKGVSDATYWLRLKVRKPASGDKSVLFIRQPFLNEVRLYEANEQDPTEWKTRVTGNLYPYADRERGTHSLGFVVDIKSPEATYYFRIKNYVWSEFAVEALTPTAADQLDKQFDILAVLFVTAMLLMLIWAMQSYFLDHLPVVGYFALHLTAFTVYGVAIMGYLAQWLPVSRPLLVELSTALPYCAVSITPVLLCRELFKPYQPPLFMMRGLDLLLLTLVFQVAAIVLGDLPLAASISNMVIRISWLYFVLMTFFLRQEQSPSRRSLQIVFIAIVSLLMAFLIARSGFPTQTQSHLYGRHMLIAHGLVVGILFCLVINARIRKIFREAQENAMHLELARQSLEIEREQKQLAERQARTDYLTGLFNRRHFAHLSEIEIERAKRYGHALSLMAIDIDHFKAINDTWGHDVGDLVLKNVADLLRDALRKSDVFARTGGEEFAAIIVETDPKGAREVAERLCAAVASAPVIPQDGVSVPVTISIGLTTLSGRNIGFIDLMKEADRLMYQSKVFGRNRVSGCDDGLLAEIA